MHHNQLRLHPHRAGSTFRYLYLCKYVSRPTAAGWVDLSSIVLAEFAFDCADAMYGIPTAAGGDDDKRRTFPPPRQAVAAVRSPVFRRPGRRRHAGCTEPVPNRHPGGGGRQSAFDSTLHNITGAYRWHTFCMSGSLYPGTTELVPGLPRDREG